MKLSFHGGAQEVTGANYLLETEKARVLIDCGLFQGSSQMCAETNRQPFTYDPSSIDALFVTHAHVDHTGRIPKLLKEGFKGKIYSTPPTKELAHIMLEDTAHLLLEESEREGYEPFYGPEDIVHAFARWETIPYDMPVHIGDLAVTLKDAGHILGSSMVSIEGGGKRILFSGDLGNVPNPLLRSYELPKGYTHIVIESAYGNRTHEDEETRRIKLERAIEDVVRRNGVLMIPAFALERTQELLFELNGLAEHGRIPPVPIFLDSPLALKATKIYEQFREYFNADAQRLIKTGDDLFRFPNLTFTEHAEESKHINDIPTPKVIIAGAGMMQGGRILHHARRYLSDPKNMILFVGYAAANSTARRILEGARTVTIHREKVPVRLEARAIGGYSAHADHDALMHFVNSTHDALEHVFVVQGEPVAALFLSQRMRDYLGVNATVPVLGDTVTL